MRTILAINKTWKRILIIGGILIGLFVTVIFIRGLILRQTASNDGEMPADIKKTIEIIRDIHGHPFIKAQEWNDVYFALGCLHARDRIISMEYYRGLAGGRLSELGFGKESLNIDRLFRIMRFTERSKTIVENISAPGSEYLLSYVKGINFIKNKRYGQFGKLPDPADREWTAEDVISILIMREWVESFLCNKELLFSFPENLSIYPLDDLIPENDLYWYKNNDQKNVFILKEIRKLVNNFIGEQYSGFAVHISSLYTHNDKSRLIFNADSPMSRYPVLYPISIKLNDLSIDGITMAGLPFINIGRNGSMTFAHFPMRVDSQDFYVEEVRMAGDKMTYYHLGNWNDFDVKEEIINVMDKGRKKLVAFNIRQTERGPVISDVFEGLHKSDVITMSSVFPGVKYINLLFAIPTLTKPQEARRFFVGMDSSPRVFLFGSDEGAEVYFSGALPDRRFPDKVLKDTGFYATDFRTIYINTTAYISNRDNFIVGDAIFKGWPQAYRRYITYSNDDKLSRLEDLINQFDILDEKAFDIILKDVYSPFAQKYIKLFIPILERIPVTSSKLARIYFHDWDFKMTVTSVPATIYYVLLTELVKETLKDELKEQTGDVMQHFPMIMNGFHKLSTTETSRLFDDITTDDKVESRDMIFDRAFLRSLRILTRLRGPRMDDWKWGTIHTSRFEIPFVAGNSLLSGRLNKKEEFEIPGSYHTLRRGGRIILEDYGTDTTIFISGVYGKDGSRISFYGGYSLNPYSKFYRLYNAEAGFLNISAEGKTNSLKLIPKH